MLTGTLTHSTSTHEVRPCRYGFVPKVPHWLQAARDQDREVGGEVGRPNVSRIAVVTGLTRVEVSSILASGGAGRVGFPGAQTALIVGASDRRLCYWRIS
jgi:hypothetical protein